MWSHPEQRMELPNREIDEVPKNTIGAGRSHVLSRLRAYDGRAAQTRPFSSANTGDSVFDGYRRFWSAVDSLTGEAINTRVWLAHADLISRNHGTETIDQARAFQDGVRAPRAC